MSFIVVIFTCNIKTYTFYKLNTKHDEHDEHDER